MTVNANTVNIKSDEAYHHGDLRAAAIALGLEKLASQEVPDLGLRAIARELGVSATALYRHFAGKEALLEALAAEGIRQLGASQKAAAQRAGGGTAAFQATGVAYVEWAVANPALFALTFAGKTRPNLAMSDADGDENEAFRQLQAGISSVLPAMAPSADRASAAMHAWSLVHGLANLILAGQIDDDPQVIRSVVAHTFGLGGGAADCA
ncbi:TetR/AcrR family transcriptional regulator [Parerythrobacter lacustris]|uniref:WHG domain-containing protein n=1 Tax=Parerythrobacter lacustris TaxID=2969984 RepID=A0ABT1XR81_9SPHN|nr:WHG domain-containing protein [Parerythrobacter lacustris]MCR2834168.1 WHG domain-containing protein [Parerythrobacter lacustris]